MKDAADVFRCLAQALYGSRWRQGAARGLGVDRRTIARWVTREATVPNEAIERLDGHLTDLRVLADHLDAMKFGLEDDPVDPAMLARVVAQLEASIGEPLVSGAIARYASLPVFVFADLFRRVAERA